MAEFAEKTHTDVSLWDALELREPMEGLSKGAHGYVVGWTGSAYELKINNRTYEVLPHQAKHRERPALDGADEEIKKDFGTCPLCDNEKTMTVADPYYACCGGQICERCADLLDLHRLSKRKCPLCGKGVEGPSRDSSTEAHAVVCRRRAKKGDARAHFALAAMEAVLSEEEQARHLLLLVDEGFAEAQYIYGSACIDHGFVSDGLRWWILAEQRGHAQASLRLSEQHFENAPPEVLGEPSSFARGLDYLHDACVRGSSEAAFSLGVLYYGGRAPHLDADPEVGTAFYRSAAELDHARGCLALADAISQADGDAAEAEKWLHRAAWLGDEDAVRVCKEAGYAPEPPHPSICAERESLRQRLSTLAVAAGRAPVVSPKKGLKKNFV
ncbi:unnamed protein product [Pelagomonas calceolata]|uniref:RING-type domain-containing protein n=1 Tax=Pelagomonas calceolata TaxID=35677 RepID=A0A7S3ZTM1_9STRA|nr:unnamed protein product [Pelagomonas calceolata]